MEMIIKFECFLISKDYGPITLHKHKQRQDDDEKQD